MYIYMYIYVYMYMYIVSLYRIPSVSSLSMLFHLLAFLVGCFTCLFGSLSIQFSQLDGSVFSKNLHTGIFRRKLDRRNQISIDLNHGVFWWWWWWWWAASNSNSNVAVAFVLMVVVVVRKDGNFLGGFWGSKRHCVCQCHCSEWCWCWCW